MRKLLVVALVALCAAFQGEVRADIPSLHVYALEASQAEIGEIEVEWVLNQVVDQTGMTYHEVRSLYEAGDLTIGKKPEGYLVSYLTADGGMGSILIQEEF